MSAESLSRDQVINILNIQYGVFLGIIFSFSFYIDTANAPVVKPAVNFLARPEALLFLMYYILDWYTANIIQFKEIPHPGGLFLRVVWVAMLGATAISLNGDGVWKYAMLTVYTVVTGIYDVFFMKKLISEKASSDSVKGLVFAGLRLIFGSMFIVPLVMCLMDRKDVLQVWDSPNVQNRPDMIFCICACYVFFKGGRFLYLAKFKEIR